VRIFETRETHAYLDERDGDEMPEPLKVSHLDLKNKVRVQPTSVTVEWERSPRTNYAWECKSVTVYGTRIHKTARESIGIHYVGGGIDATAAAGEMSDWVARIVAKTAPNMLAPLPEMVSVHGQR
jgi:hypothetical protein